jgi:hypothetical protein
VKTQEILYNEKGLLNLHKVMPTIQLTIPDSLQRFVQGQVAERGLDQPDQYIEQLLEEERNRKRDEYYYQKCLEGLASGPGILVTEENNEAFWNDMKDRIRRRYESRQKQKAMQ